jgi:hypothetical protein
MRPNYRQVDVKTRGSRLTEDWPNYFPTASIRDMA